MVRPVVLRHCCGELGGFKGLFTKYSLYVVKMLFWSVLVVVVSLVCCNGQLRKENCNFPHLIYKMICYLIQDHTVCYSRWDGGC